MTIKKIEITNIKGIKNKTFNFILKPNKPNILVAPNGFGKTSIATAFKAMTSSKISLNKKDYYQENQKNKPTLSITTDTTQLTATENKNEINTYFDISVISNSLIPKATKHNMGKFTYATAHLEIPPIDICSIPTRKSFEYQASEFKAAFGKNNKILPNIDKILENHILPQVLYNIDLSKTTGSRIKEKITKEIAIINTLSGTSSDIFARIKANQTNNLKNIKPLSDLAYKLKTYNLTQNFIEGFLIAYQIAKLYEKNKTSFNNAIKWLKYKQEKANYKDLLKSFCTSDWQWAELCENKKKSKLHIVFPQGHQLSNGQRDLLILVLHMHKKLYEGIKKPLFLLIDEVFDYLDDANLVAFQYYITNLIDKYKHEKQIIYPIILTHLDPGTFFHFCFNSCKLNIHYLEFKNTGKAKNTLHLIELREKEYAFTHNLETYWFHYNPKTYTINENWPNNLPADWSQSDKFHTYTLTEVNRYIETKNFDPIAVCFAVRIMIEKKIYNLLNDSDTKKEFINEHTTRKKLRYAASKGCDIPETYFLLGFIYNTNLHWQQGRDYVSPLTTKLSHRTIKKLIKDIFNN